MSHSSEADTSLAALNRRKWLILAGAVVCAALAAGYTLLGPPRYSTSTLVEVGKVMGAELDDAFAVAQLVNSPGFAAAARARASSAPATVTAEALTGGQGRLEHPTLVRITSTAATPDNAVAAGNAAVDELLDRQQQRFSAAMVAYLEQEKALVEMGPPAEKDLADLRARMASPTVTAKTAVKDPFPAPTAPAPRNTAAAAALGFVVSAAILALLVIALAAVAPHQEPDGA